MKVLIYTSTIQEEYNLNRTLWTGVKIVGGTGEDSCLSKCRTRCSDEGSGDQGGGVESGVEDSCTSVLSLNSNSRVRLVVHP